MKQFLKKSGVIIGLFFGAAIFSSLVPQYAFFCAIISFFVVVVSLFKPLPQIHLGNRGFSTALLIFVILPTLIGSAEGNKQEQEANLIAMKKNDPIAYLRELEKTDKERWLKELTTLDPEKHALEIKKIDDEKALRLKQEQENAAIKRKEKHAKECGEKNEILAYVMSQEFVKRRLKAPATAEFPDYSTKITTRALGDCKYKIIAYVDSQNSFGALLRATYSATMLHNYETSEWAVLELDIQGQ